MIDRRHRPGGHWLDSYPFVQLHQPSMNYGVNSTPLGQDRVEPDGRDAGFYERASGTEICGYYDEIMRHRFLASGRVRFFPMCDYLGDRRFRSRVTGDETDVSVRRRVVDATYMASRVPATDPPPFEVADGVTCVPVGALTKVDEAAGRLRDHRRAARPRWTRRAGCSIKALAPRRHHLDPSARLVDPEPRVLPARRRVSFPRSRASSWSWKRSPSATRSSRSSSGSRNTQVVFRIDPSVEPTMLKGATPSLGELDQLRRIENVVRLGHVERIDLDAITLEHGSIPTSPDHLHIHCASAGLERQPAQADLRRRHDHPPAGHARQPQPLRRR